MAWGKRLVLLLSVVVVVVVDGFNSTKFGQSSSSVAVWAHDDEEDGVLREMNFNWENKLLFLVPLSHDMLDWMGNAVFFTSSRKHTFGNISSTEMSDDDDKGDGTRENFPFAVSNRELNADVDVPITEVDTGGSNPAGLTSRKILRQMRRRSERRKERRRKRRRSAQPNHTNTWISESTLRAPMFDVLLTLGSSASEMERTVASTGPLWPDVQGPRGWTEPSLLSTEDFREKKGNIVHMNYDWKTYGDSLKKPAVLLKEGQMHGKERTTGGKKGKGKNSAEKQLKRKKDRKGNLRTELVLQFSQQQ